MILEILYSTGIRRQELINLELKNIDINNKTIKVLGKSISFGSNPNFDFSAIINVEIDGKLTLAVNSIIVPTKSYNLSFLILKAILNTLKEI